MTKDFSLWYVNAELHERVAHFLKYLELCHMASGGRTLFIPLATVSPMMRSFRVKEDIIQLQEQFEEAWQETSEFVLKGILIPTGKLIKYVQLATHMNTLREEYTSSLICHSCLLQSGYLVLRDPVWSAFGIPGKCNICEQGRDFITHPEVLNKITELGLEDAGNNSTEFRVIHYLVHCLSVKEGYFN